MALSSTQITGPIYLPNLEKPDSAKIVFELSSWDREEGEAVFVTGPYVGDIDSGGNFSVNLFTTASGENNVAYRVSVMYLTLEGTYKREQLGTMALAGPGPYKLADITFVNEWVPNSFDILAEAASYKDGAEAAYDLAAAALAALAAIDSRKVNTFDDLASISSGDLVTGEFWVIEYGNTLLEVVTSGQDITLGNGKKLKILRNPKFDFFNVASGTEFVKYPNGTSGVLDGSIFEVNSALTGGASAGNAFGVDGIYYDPGRDAEIDAVLALTFPAGTLVGTTDTQSLSNKTLSNPIITGKITLNGKITELTYLITGTTPALNAVNGTLQFWTLTGNSTPTSALENGDSISIMVDNGSARTINWSMVDEWLGGSSPVLQDVGYTMITIFKAYNIIYGIKVGDFS